MLASRIACRAGVAVLCLLCATTALADRYHVAPGGSRLAGPSLVGDWTAENCYATVALAAATAGAADSILCDLGAHAVDSVVPLAVAFLGARGLGTDPASVDLQLGDTGQLAPPPGHPALTMQGLTISGGTDQRVLPGVTAFGLDLTLVACDLVGLHATSTINQGGAALRLDGGGNLTATDSRFLDNTSVGRGGAVWLGAGHDAVFTGCHFERNTARGGADPRGGALFVDARAAMSTLVMNACELHDNVSGGPGGAVSTISADALYEDCMVTGNRSGLDNGWSEGAGLHHRRNTGDHDGEVFATARRCVFVDNQGLPDVVFNGGDGGAFYTIGAAGPLYIHALVEDCEFVGNFNLQGSGVYVSRWSDGVVRRSRFIDNIAYHMGGGVFKGGPSSENIGETLTVDQCLFVRNLAGFTADGVPANSYCRGGAICVRMNPRLIARHCTFIDNRIHNSGYRFGDAFAHYFEFGAWEPEMLCELQNCVFWGEDGVHVQVFSSQGGMAVADNLAAADGELNLGGLAPVNSVVLTANPFDDGSGGHPSALGGLVDAGLELGFTSDLDGMFMPVGPAPDIGCFEYQSGTPVTDLPLAHSSLTAAPNPFNPRTVLSARLADQGRVWVQLVDARGRHVRTLHDGALPAGTHHWAWDGRDNVGRDCAAGVYLARLVVDGRPAGSMKLALVR